MSLGAIDAILNGMATASNGRLPGQLQLKVMAVVTVRLPAGQALNVGRAVLDLLPLAGQLVSQHHSPAIGILAHEVQRADATGIYLVVAAELVPYLSGTSNVAVQSLPLVMVRKVAIDDVTQEFVDGKIGPVTDKLRTHGIDGNVQLQPIINNKLSKSKLSRDWPAQPLIAMTL
jgi:hypothetical protein